MSYFDKRPPQAQRDADFALNYVKHNAKTPEQQQAVLAALEFKCGVLWAMLDALYHAYVAPKQVPPGAFVPERHMNDQRAAQVPDSAHPRLPRGVRLTHNEAQGGWVLLAPERVFKADAIAARNPQALHRRGDGGAIVDDLAKTFNAPRERIHADVVKLLGGAGRQEVAGALAWPRTDTLPSPLGLLAELTHRCPLGCPYCSNPLALDPRADELDTATWARVFREAAGLGVLQVHLSGGEPAARRDLADIVDGRARGRALQQSDHLGGRPHAADLGRARRRRPRSRADLHPGQRAEIRRPYRRL